MQLINESKCNCGAREKMEEQAVALKEARALFDKFSRIGLRSICSGWLMRWGTSGAYLDVKDFYRNHTH